MFDENLKTATGNLAKRLADVDRVLDMVSTAPPKRIEKRREVEPDDLFKGYPEYNPSQPRGDDGRWGGGGGSDTRAMVARTGGKKPKGSKSPKMSLKEIASKFRAAKNKRTQVRQQIRGLQSRIKDMKRGSPSHKKATARLKQLKESGANLTREMGRLSNLAASRRGPVRQQDWLQSTMAGLPVFGPPQRRGLKRASDTSTDDDDLFVLKGYPEFDPDQVRGDDGKWTAGGGGRSRGGKKPKAKPATTTGKPKPPAKKPKKPKAAPAAKPKAPPKKKPAPPKKPKTVKPKSEVKQPRKPRTPKPKAPDTAAAAPEPVKAPESGLVARDRAALDHAYAMYDWTTERIGQLEAHIDTVRQQRPLSYSSDAWREISELGTRRKELEQHRGKIIEYEARMRAHGVSTKRNRISKRAAPCGGFRYQTKLLKASDDLGLIFGWAIVSSQNGEPYYDTQGDHIPEDAMLSAAADFMLSNRSMKVMHEGKKAGTVVFAWPMTEEVARAMGISGERTGLMIAVKPDNPNVLARFRSKQYTGFSIGGTRLIDEEVVDD